MPMLELQKLTKSFGGLTAVNSVDLAVEKGQIVGLIGPNGAGKTTVFNLIMGTFRPSKGKILFKGKDITGLKPHVVAGLGLARSFQQTLLFNDMTVLKNIQVGFSLKSRIGFWNNVLDTPYSRKREKELLSKAEEILQLMGLEHVKNEMPKNLPYGYQKALGIAIALATEPELLLLDEPVTGMNTQEIDWILEKIRQLKEKGLTIFIVEHHMRVVMSICERVFVLNFGNKIAEGAPIDICNDKSVISAYLGPQYAIKC